MSPLLKLLEKKHKYISARIFSYRSLFQPSDKALDVLRQGKIISANETANMMVERMVDTLFDIEHKFGTPQSQINRLKVEFGKFVDQKYCVMSTPVMTNAGRYQNKPLSACTVPPLDLRRDLALAKEIINEFHQEGIGTGFSLDDVEDPVAVLKYLNSIAVAGANSGKEDRPVGNMAILSVHHPRIREFIYAKSNSDALGEDWKFNISINASDEFMTAVNNGTTYKLHNGLLEDAKEILTSIVTSAHGCGDPGLIFIDRMNKDNPTPVVGNYVSTAPCAEVGLTLGESCQFGYINLGKFVNKIGSEKVVDWSNLELITRLMVRALDNALEYSIERYPHELNKSVMRAKRKIGVGVCGLADMLIELGLPYSSLKARELARDVVAYINYVSKLESVALAERGSFSAMYEEKGCLYNDNPGFLFTKYGILETKKVPMSLWKELDKNIRQNKLLRNASTIALPPTGRSGLVIDATPGVEPLFSLVNYDGSVNESLTRDLKELDLYSESIESHILQYGRIGNSTLPKNLKLLYQTALEIKPDNHLEMVALIQQAVDESISKTINMPEETMPEQIMEIYKRAYQFGLKGITIFRTGSRTIQPRALAKT